MMQRSASVHPNEAEDTSQSHKSSTLEQMIADIKQEEAERQQEEEQQQAKAAAKRAKKQRQKAKRQQADLDASATSERDSSAASGSEPVSTLAPARNGSSADIFLSEDGVKVKGETEDRAEAAAETQAKAEAAAETEAKAEAEAEAEAEGDSELSPHADIALTFKSVQASNHQDHDGAMLPLFRCPITKVRQGWSKHHLACLPAHIGTRSQIDSPCDV